MLNKLGKAGLKRWLLLIIMMLPCVAFADTFTRFNFFTPLSTDYSLSALQTIFGSMGNVLPGRGNQLFGTLVGVFNACWVVAIGVAVLFLIWDSIMHAAQSGAGMAGHGRKSVLKIIGVVIGFTLAVPSSSTGYSLGQNAVVWSVIQGIGIADKIYGRMYDYFMQGGVVVTMDPPAADDMKAFMNPAATILQGQICLYKLEDIKLAEKKANEAAASGDINKLPSYSYDHGTSEVGYSINADDTITMGTINDKYVAENPASHRYNDECGKVKWEYKHDTILARMAGTNYDYDAYAQERTATLAYVKSATIDLFNSLAPMARQIASIDPNTASNPDASAQFKAIAPSGAQSLANSGIVFATVIDPARRLVMVNRASDLTASMNDYRTKGWIFTPFMMTIPGLYDGQVVSIANYTPAATAPDVARLTTISEEQRSEISKLISHVDSDNYVINAMTDLDSYYANTALNADLSFEAFLQEYNPEEDTGSVDSVVDWIDSIMEAPKGAISLTKGFTTTLVGGMGDTIGAFNTVFGFFQGIDDLFDQIDDCVDSVTSTDVFDGGPDCNISFNMGSGYSELKNAQNALYAASDYAGKDLQSAIKGIDDMITDLKQDAANSKKGGMNDQIRDLTYNIGPIGPILAVMLTSMIGKSFGILEDNVNMNKNAMMTSIKVGGSMMTASLEAVFSAGRALYVSSMVEGALSGFGAIMGYGSSGAGSLVSKAPGGAVGLANKGMMMVVPAYVALALLFFAGGMLLFIMVPLIWIMLFVAVALRWMGLVIINVLAAPIFCFNLIRADGDGLIGKGDRFLADLLRTVITPAVLIIGAIAFMVLFNITFELIAYLLTNFLPLLFQIKPHAYLVSISLASILMVFGLLMTYLVNLLGNLCTSDLVNAVGNSIDHAFGEVKGAHGMPEQMHHGLSSASEQMGAGARGVSVDHPQSFKKGMDKIAETYVEQRNEYDRKQEEARQKEEQERQANARRNNP